MLAGGATVVYRVEYQGEDIDLATLDAALDTARTAIANDLDRFDGYAVDHDDGVNDWFVQAVRNGRRVGAAAVITGPEPKHTPDVVEEWEKRVSFVGGTPAEAFAMAAKWLKKHPEIGTLGDVGWHHTVAGHQLRLYFRG